MLEQKKTKLTAALPVDIQRLRLFLSHPARPAGGIIYREESRDGLDQCIYTVQLLYTLDGRLR